MTFVSPELREFAGIQLSPLRTDTQADSDLGTESLWLEPSQKPETLPGEVLNSVRVASEESQNVLRLMRWHRVCVLYVGVERIPWDPGCPS